MKNKQKQVRFRHHFLTRLIAPIVGIFIKGSYKLKIKQYKALKGKGPFVVLGNHTVNVDPIIMGLLFPFPLYYIATEQIFNLGFLSKALKYIVNPIKKSKAVSDLETIRKTRKIVLEGGSIGIFPEGNTTYTGETGFIEPSTVKLIKMLKIPVIIMNTQGLYLSYPRWAVYRKKGKTHALIKRIILPDMYIKLTDEAFYEMLKIELHVNAYDDQESSGLSFKGKNIAHGLEKLVFMDLETEKPFVTYSKNNMLLSKVSDFKLTYLPSGRVLDKNNQEHTLIDIDKQVKAAYFNFYQHTKDDLLFEEAVHLSQSFSDYKNKLGQYNLALYKDQLVFKSKDKTLTYVFDDIKQLVIQGKYQVIIYTKDETFIMKLDKYSSPYKYLLTYQFYKYTQLGDDLDYDNNYHFGI